MSGPQTWCEGCGGLAREIGRLKAECAGLKYTLDMWVAECGEGGPRAIKAELDDARSHNQTLARAYEKQENRALAAEAEVERLTEHLRGQARIATEAINSLHGVANLEADVKALAEALESAFVTLALLEKHVRPPHEDDWPFKKIQAALSRDGVRRGRGEGR